MTLKCDSQSRGRNSVVVGRRGGGGGVHRAQIFFIAAAGKQLSPLSLLPSFPHSLLLTPLSSHVEEL